MLSSDEFARRPAERKEPAMQKIEAVIRPEKILDVKAALEGFG